ncbi:FAD-dependent oxidoreductase [Streptomyces misionensis]
MSRARVVIVGAGSAGYRAARTSARGRAGITLPDPTDHFLYPPLPPQVAAGVPETRGPAVPLPGTLRGVRPVPVGRIDLDARTVGHTGPEGDMGPLGPGRHRRPHRHRDPGFAVDLGVPPVRTAAGAVTGARHLLAPPGNRLRAAAGRPDAVPPRRGVRSGPVRSRAVPPDAAAPEPPREPPGAPAR